jgi:hypothetical protein
MGQRILESGTYIMCEVCGFIRSDMSPDNHVRVVHHGLPPVDILSQDC